MTLYAIVYERSMCDAVLESVTDAELIDFFYEPFRKLLVYILMDEECVYAYTSLAGMSGLGSDCIVNCKVDISVFKHDERCQLAEFH